MGGLGLEATTSKNMFAEYRVPLGCVRRNDPNVQSYNEIYFQLKKLDDFTCTPYTLLGQQDKVQMQTSDLNLRLEDTTSFKLTRTLLNAL